jgi:hypothetical protein
MAVESRVNPNFPLPGIDQSSKGFRDNFTIIKKEIENLQGKTIQLEGAIVSDTVSIDGGTAGVVLTTSSPTYDAAFTSVNNAITSLKATTLTLQGDISGGPVYLGGTAPTGATGPSLTITTASLVYRKQFTIADLTGNLLTVNHDLNQSLVIVQVYDNNSQLFSPTSITLTDSNVVTIDLTNAPHPLAGTWGVIVRG